MQRLKALSYRWRRRFIGRLIRPKIVGADLADLGIDKDRVFYVLEQRSISDLIAVDLVCEARGLASPLDAIRLGERTEARRFCFLHRASHGWFRRPSMATYSRRLVRVLAQAEADVDAVIVPVGVFWSRAPHRERSLVRGLFSESWAVTSKLKRLVSLFVNRSDIVVHIGQPLPLAELAQCAPDRVVRRAARLLRVQFRNQRLATMGPDLSHRRTLINVVLASRQVRDAITAEQLRAPRRGGFLRLERRARKAALAIASNMSYPTVRVLERVLTWFWNRIYRGIEVNHLAAVSQIAETHTLVYVPSHRSHLDYLLLSYLLYQNGLMIPHIAAGDNLDLPVLGNILRRGGAFFMRRKFRDDRIYSAVFSEYLYQVYRKGHGVEFFPEGGRTRTGRLLPARLGLLNMTIVSHERGLPRPLAMIPVYFGYEKLVEGGSYLDELRGSGKKRESLGDLLASLRLIRQNFGKVTVNFGRPLPLAEWVSAFEAAGGDASTQGAAALGRELLVRINDAAAVNAVNLVALVTLGTPRLAMGERPLAEQVECYRDLLLADAAHHEYTVTRLSGRQAMRYVEELGMLRREQQEFGDVITLDPFTAVLLTWYRNNVVHTLALPSFLACLISNRRRPVSEQALQRMAAIVFPYVADEVNCRDDAGSVARWLGHLCRAGLLEARGDGYRPPQANSAAHYRLHQLARIVKPSLERLYIVVRLLHDRREDGITRPELERQSQQLARKMARLYGIDAPEFFDSRLFNRFIDRLLKEGVVSSRDDGCLQHSSVINDVIRAANTVIDAEFRFALMGE